MTRKQQILDLHKQGYNGHQISKILNCRPNMVYYYISPEEKQKVYERNFKRRTSIKSILNHKLKEFKKIVNYKQEYLNNRSIRKIIYNRVLKFQEFTMNNFTTDDALKKFGDSPKCYLTGEPIDLSKSRTYNLDHIIPRSKGGDNSLENLGLCTRIANQSKFNMTPEEYIEHCKKVLINFGYKVSKESTS